MEKDNNNKNEKENILSDFKDNNGKEFEMVDPNDPSVRLVATQDHAELARRLVGGSPMPPFSPEQLAAKPLIPNNDEDTSTTVPCSTGGNTVGTQSIHFSLEEVLDQVLNNDLSKNFAVDDAVISKDQVSGILFHLARSNNTTLPLATSAVYRLFLKGAANFSTPNSLRVTFLADNGDTITISKEELVSSYRKIMGNSYVRRLAEFLATDISRYAEKWELTGDLANHISVVLLKDTDEPLTMKEKAWCSSFNQRNNKCSNEFPRVMRLLSQDYNYKFKRDPSKNTKSVVTSSPRRQPNQPRKGKGTVNKISNAKGQNQTTSSIKKTPLFPKGDP